MKLNKIGSARFSTAVAAAAVLIAFLIFGITQANGKGEQTKATQKKPVNVDVQVELVPLAGDGRIEIGLAPAYESKNSMVESTTKLEKVETPSNAEFFLGSGGNIRGISYLNRSGTYRAVEETRTSGLPGGASITCKQEHKYILEAKVVGGQVDRKKKPPVLLNIELEVKDFDAENKKTCEVTPPGVVVPSETKYDNGLKAKWWRTALYNWPLEDGYSEVIGRFQYTLHLKFRSECDQQLSQSLDEARDRFDSWVENCVGKSGVVTKCDADMLRRCVLYIFQGDRDTSILDNCIESACDVSEEGLTQCLREAMSLYMTSLIKIEKQYKECMGQ